MTNNLTPNKLFNIDGDDSKENRQIWFGNSTNLIELNNVKYDWGVQLYKQMRENVWIPEKVNLSRDETDYNNLTSSEKRAFDGILSYLTFLDSIQTQNIPYIKICVTAPEISICLNEQISQETVHSQSYQTIIESIIPPSERDGIYNFWRTDNVLLARCQYISDLYQKYIDDKTPENYLVALFADYLLEGLYFYNGFQYFYSLTSRGLMGGCAEMFKLINRDELSHVRLFQKLLNEAFSTNAFKYSVDQLLELTDVAVQYECEWTMHITGNNVLGITEDSTDQYTKYLANKRLKAIGLNPLYTDKKYNTNPYKHLEKFSSTEDNTKPNFFETTVSNYTMASTVKGWDF